MARVRPLGPLAFWFTAVVVLGLALWPGQGARRACLAGTSWST